METDMCQQIAAVSSEDVYIANHIFIDILTPSTCEILCTFDIHVKSVTSETYEDYNE